MAPNRLRLRHLLQCEQHSGPRPAVAAGHTGFRIGVLAARVLEGVEGVVIGLVGLLVIWLILILLGVLVKGLFWLVVVPNETPEATRGTSIFDRTDLGA
jgi:hypothetical protein